MITFCMTSNIRRVRRRRADPDLQPLCIVASPMSIIIPVRSSSSIIIIIITIIIIIIMAAASLVTAGAVIAFTDHKNSETDDEHLSPSTKVVGDYKRSHHKYDLIQHFGDIGRILKADPLTDWNSDSFSHANVYHRPRLTDGALYHIRRNPGVQSVSRSKSGSCNLRPSQQTCSMF
jgi:hypothetical protein